MARNPSEKQFLFNALAVREALFKNVEVPSDLLKEALRVQKEKLTARKTLFFTHKGRVQDKREVEDHEVQLRASENVLGMAELRSRSVVEPHSQEVELIFDPETGVMRLRIGGARLAPVESPSPSVVDITPVVKAKELPPGEVINWIETGDPQKGVTESPSDQVEEPKKPGPDRWKTLLDEEVEC